MRDHNILWLLELEHSISWEGSSPGVAFAAGCLLYKSNTEVSWLSSSFEHVQSVRPYGVAILVKSMHTGGC